MNAPDLLDINTLPFWYRLGTALVCGGAIGTERQLRGKAAGIRTSILICLGTELFVSLGLSAGNAAMDPTRVLGQVITGIGFLGAGVILTRESKILGVTSAAVIWLIAALGGLIGFGHIAASYVVTLVTLFVLVGLGIVEGWYGRMRAERPAKILNEIDIEL